MQELFPAGRTRRHLLQGGLAAALAGPLAGPAAQAAPARRAAPPVPPRLPASAVRRLADQYFDARLEADPFLASFLGLATPAQAGQLPQEPTSADRQRERQRTAQMLRDLARVDPRPLGEAERITYDTLRHAVRSDLAALEHPQHLLPLDPMQDNPLLVLANAADNGLCAFATAADHEQHLKRLRQLPAWCAQATANLREGLRTGVVLPAPIVDRLLPLLQRLGEVSLARNPFFQPLLRLPPHLNDRDQRRLRDAYGPVLSQQVLPALRRLARFMAEDYRPRARSSDGLGALPGGAAWYAQAVRSATTTGLSPDRIHALGLREVERLKARLNDLRERMGFDGPLAAFHAWHAERPATRPFRTEAEVLAAYRALDDRIGAGLPALFHRLPRAALEIRPEPALTRDTASDHYTSPAVDGSRPGVFYAVIPEASRQATTGMATLLLHEGRPGHHLQVALAQELDLPRLQRHGGFEAYVEGWAHYAETLGYDLGLYADDDAHMGHLADTMLRAARLVVDTGLHAQGWTRERAMAYLSELTGYDERAARAEVERYMVWPGQALAYAVGRLGITALRDAARGRLGAAFSLPDFHEQVLGSGALPMDVLSAKLNRWVQARTPAPLQTLQDLGPPQVVADPDA